VLIFIRVILSWVNVGYNGFTQFIYGLTEPFLGIFRRIIPPRPNFPLDLSPVLAIVVLELLRSVLLRLLMFVF